MDKKNQSDQIKDVNTHAIARELNLPQSRVYTTLALLKLPKRR